MPQGWYDYSGKTRERRRHNKQRLAIATEALLIQTSEKYLADIINFI
jgi:hypothetical protein